MADHPNYYRNRRHLAMVRAYLEAEIPVWKIGKLLKVSESTIRRHYGAEIAAAELIGGRRPFEPSSAQRTQVQLMAALGVSQDQIASHLDIAIGTLEKHFRDELDKGKLQADTMVGANLFKMATGPADQKTTVTAAIWWTKARMGWKDTSRIESTGPDGGPLKTEHQVVVMLPDNSRGDCPIVLESEPVPETSITPDVLDGSHDDGDLPDDFDPDAEERDFLRDFEAMPEGDPEGLDDD